MNATPITDKSALATFTCPVNREPLRCLVDEVGQPWFVARDAALALGYSNPSRSVQDHCKHVKLLKATDSVVLGIPPRGMQIIPEADVYRLIIRSAMKEAETFERWVMEEVLPSIRKFGAYINESTLNRMLTDPDYCLSVVASLDVERRQRRELEDKVCVMEPKAMVYDAVVADRQPTLRQFARRLGRINLNKLTHDLMMLGYLHRQGGGYHPYAKYRDTHFSEKVNAAGISVLVVLDEGKKLLTKLWQEGKLSRRKK